MLSFVDKKKEQNEFFAKYNSVTNKLKKRFLRKPNVSEITEQFCSLAEECEKEENHQYAALCWINAAKCQSLLDNKSVEIHFLTKAGRKFLEIERKSINIGCPSVGQENAQIAVNLFDHAIELCQTDNKLKFIGSGLAIELSNSLGPTASSVQLLKKANESQTFIPAVEKLVSSLIFQGDFVSALQTLSEMVEVLEKKSGSRSVGYYRDILRRCEINRVLLILILQLTPQKLTPSNGQVLEKYAWAEDESSKEESKVLNTDEEILVQSLVLACQSKDHGALLEMEDDLGSFLDCKQRDLLRILVKMYGKV